VRVSGKGGRILAPESDSTPPLAVHIFRRRSRASNGVPHMRNLIEAAIDDPDGDHAAKIIRDALGIESDEVTNHSFPKHWPNNREQRARIIGDWLRDESRFAVYPSD
jgi:hypothetical protein